MLTAPLPECHDIDLIRLLLRHRSEEKRMHALAIAMLLMARDVRRRQVTQVVNLITQSDLLGALSRGMEARCMYAAVATLGLLSVALSHDEVATAVGAAVAKKLLSCACGMGLRHWFLTSPLELVTRAWIRQYLSLTTGAAANMLCMFMLSSQYMSLLLLTATQATPRHAALYILMLSYWAEWSRQPLGLGCLRRDAVIMQTSGLLPEVAGRLALCASSQPQHRQRLGDLFAPLRLSSAWQLKPPHVFLLLRPSYTDCHEAAYMVLRLAMALQYSATPCRGVVVGRGVEMLLDRLTAAVAADGLQAMACIQGLETLLLALLVDDSCSTCEIARVLPAVESLLRLKGVDLLEKGNDIGGHAIALAILVASRHRVEKPRALLSLAATVRKVYMCSQGVAARRVGGTNLRTVATAIERWQHTPDLVQVAMQLMPPMVYLCASFSVLGDALGMLHTEGLSHLLASRVCIDVILEEGAGGVCVLNKLATGDTNDAQRWRWCLRRHGGLSGVAALEEALSAEKAAAAPPKWDAVVQRGCCCYRRCVNLSGPRDDLLPLRKCGGCRRAEYCSPECQARAWRSGHRTACGTIALL